MPSPAHEPRLARVAALVADASRARMLCFLLGGEYASAGELARAAGVSAATASAHLAQLIDAGLLACDPRGRHRYYRLADGDVAHALEALAMVAERDSHARAWSSPARARLRAARCCYGHLAGRAGVGLLQGMVDQRWLGRIGVNGYEVTDRGADALSAGPRRCRVATPLQGQRPHRLWLPRLVGAARPSRRQARQRAAAARPSAGVAAPPAR